MVISDFLGVEFPPSALLVLAEKNNMNIRPMESGDGIFRNQEFLSLLGIKLENDKNQPIYGYDKIKDAMADDDKLIIANTQHSIFTDGGHYIVLTGYEDNGKVHVNDPNYYNYYTDDGKPNLSHNGILYDGYQNGFDETRIANNTGGYYIFSRTDEGLSQEEIQEIIDEANNKYPATKEYGQKYDTAEANQDTVEENQDTVEANQDTAE